MKNLASRDAKLVKKIRILLAEDHAIFRKSLRTLIELDGNLEVVGEAKNGKEAVKMAGRLKPDIVVMDIGMPIMNGLEATRRIIGMVDAAKVLILSSYSDPEYIRTAMDVGASGYLVKQSSAPILLEAILEVMKGKAYFSPSIPKSLRNGCQKTFDKRFLLN